ncbi:hypothetical protein [Halobacillus litoralis]|uniref:hypothetical protein n=1 Tax=Halobacillus litoralis TaxID=45668 RepID=UPI001CD67658|nr:hypothetical protein [Halobacillus litoralis]MCA1022045.1 hypothetical protein [Halobacillus litoralis]
MSHTYRDYFNETVVTIPDKYIDVRTGHSEAVEAKVRKELAYHAENNTLQHFLLSALHQYLSAPGEGRPSGEDPVLRELRTIKEMLTRGTRPSGAPSSPSVPKLPSSGLIDQKELEDMLEAFGG